jgi:hypothetical protein
MKTVIVWVLSVQIWSDPPPRIQVQWNKEFATHESCMEERAKWSDKFTALCLTKVKTQ